MTSFWWKWRNWWRRSSSSDVDGCRRWKTLLASSHVASKWARLLGTWSAVTWSWVTWSSVTWSSRHVRESVTHILSSSSHCSPSRQRMTTGTYRPSGPVTQAMYSWQSVDDGWRLYRGWFCPHVADDGSSAPFRATDTHVCHFISFTTPQRK